MRLLIAGTGPGLALATALREAGDHVVVGETDRMPGSPTGALVAEAVARLGHLDGVIHVAGAMGAASLGDGPEADTIWERTLAGTLDGFWRLCRASLPHLSPGSRILAICPATSHGPAAAAASHATVGLVRSLALELANRRITVNAVAIDHASPAWIRYLTGPAAAGITAQAFGFGP